MEITSCFYRHHRAQTYARWAQSVGESFRFSVKTPRELTHQGALVQGKNAELERFLSEISGLGAKLGALLVQLPPSLEFDAAATRRFFRRLRRGIPDSTALVCEPRHVSWATHEADSTLRGLGVSRAAVDPTRWDADGCPGGDTRLAYFRWHGAPRIYYSDYDAGRLAQLAAILDQWSRLSRQVWCIFDNTAHGHAIGNALTVQTLTQDAVVPAPQIREAGRPKVHT